MRKDMGDEPHTQENKKDRDREIRANEHTVFLATTMAAAAAVAAAAASFELGCRQSREEEAEKGRTSVCYRQS
jgi:hypothetical protein